MARAQCSIPTIQLFLRFLLLLTWVSSGAIHAEEAAIKPGTTLKAGNSVKVRDAPPYEKFLVFIGKPGNEIQQLDSGETFQVKEVKQISVPFGKDIWIKGVTSKGTTGWAYYGNEEKTVNFVNPPKE